MVGAGCCGYPRRTRHPRRVPFSPHRPAVIKYTQITDFTDSAATPALSQDGHILAFIRGDSHFMSADQIYAKVLPDGEARRLTNDPRIKYNLAFSPDGSSRSPTRLWSLPPSVPTSSRYWEVTRIFYCTMRRDSHGSIRGILSFPARTRVYIWES